MLGLTKNKACILLPLWGADYLGDFLRYSLPSLLAEGNIPALSQRYQTRFVLLTRLKEIPYFEMQPAFQKLKTICQVEFLSIDDLIVHGHYAATLTLAYDRAIQQTGPELLNTYFIFLVSDFIMAAGSLEGLMRYMEKGYSGICAGNFQVIKEEMEGFLDHQFNAETQTLELKPQTLLEACLDKLHPVTLAAIINQDFVHNYRINRLFYRHDQQVMAGRFYLLHMLCIKPELINYKIGSSCDYSFIPEMCPSGRVAVISDSDDYLVIELQPREHELGLVAWGKPKLKQLALSLAEWTTTVHRDNAKTSIYYHSRPLTEADKLAIEHKLENLTSSLAKELINIEPKPSFGHPYWQAEMHSFQQQKVALKGRADLDYKDLAQFTQSNTHFKRIYYRCFGVPPNVFPWHYRFAEYYYLKKFAKEVSKSLLPQNTAVFYTSYQDDFMRYSSWFKAALAIQQHYDLMVFLQSEPKFKKKYELLYLFTRIEEWVTLPAALEKMSYLLQPQSKIIVLVSNVKDRNLKLVLNFEDQLKAKLHSVMSFQYKILSVNPVYDNFSWLGSIVIKKIEKNFLYSKKLKFALFLILGFPGSLLTLARNCLLPFYRTKRGHCAHIFLTLELSKES